ncbi:MAG: TIGR00730 family Rossman fold protein [Candidatus Binatia bacterium]
MPASTPSRIGVFCGSSPGVRAEFGVAADRLGAALARAGIGLVYGGASVGLMGRLADSALAAGGEVIGVIPRALVEQEVAHHSLADLRVVGSMHERKALMADLADGFIALPGGLGTLDELFEILTWAQLGLHHKPVGLLEVAGYFAPLLAFLDGAVAARFLAPAHRAMLLVADEPAALLAAFRAHQPPPPFKWIDRPAR